VDCTVHATASEERLISSVHNAVHLELGDVIADDRDSVVERLGWWKF
jgi:hypothetical protein